MPSHMPPVRPANQSPKGSKQPDESARDTSHKKDHLENTAEQGDTANVKQNTTNKSFYKGRRTK